MNIKFVQSKREALGTRKIFITVPGQIQRTKANTTSTSNYSAAIHG
jgi:hypothetical protein